MSYLLDTNVWIAYLSQKPSPVQAKIAAINPAEIWLCDVVKAELYFGAYKSARVPENIARLDSLFTVVRSVPFDHRAAQHFGQLRAHLATAGTPIGPYDLQIASIALTHQLTLVTHNTREFERVPGLRLVDWE